MDRIDFEKLIVPKCVAAWRMNKGKRPDDVLAGLTKEDSESAASAITFGILCDGTPTYLFEIEEATRAIASAESFAVAELPPLPFPKMALESSTDVCLGTKEGPLLDALVIHGDQEGWLVGELYEKPGDAMWLQQSQIVPGGLAKTLTLDGWEENPHLASQAVELVHLVTARGVSVERIIAPRATRRRFARETGTEYPEFHFVNIRDAGEKETGDGSGRTYQCRWVVRGHWRHLASGKTTWVTSHIKGPAGAPWRGTPIYVREAA